MRTAEELILRCAMRRDQQLGGLSPQGFEELLRAVAQSPETFADNPEDQAFLDLVRAIDRFERDMDNDDLLDDDEYLTHREERRQAMEETCSSIAEACPGCLDARTIAILMAPLGQDEMLGQLIDLEEGLGPFLPSVGVTMGAPIWDDVFDRPRLRLKMAVVRGLMETARFGMAVEKCDELMGLGVPDELGARHTAGLALARLEDEGRFYSLYGHGDDQSCAWYYLANALLLYKLDRLSAARRALNGFAGHCEGGAYALLRPVLVEAYLPDRPGYAPGGFEEAVLAVHEADPIIVDTPDFIAWASEQPGFAESARAFADREGFDW